MIELVWIALSLAGVVVSAIGLKHAHDGVQSPLNQHNGSRIVARGYRRGEALTLIKQIVLLSLALPPLLDPAPVRVSPFVLALFAILILGLMRSTLELRDRVRIRRMDDERSVR